MSNTVDVFAPPNVEALVRFFLAAQPEVLDYLDPSRVLTDVSGAMSRDEPVIRVTQFFDSAVTNHPLWLVEAHLQIEVWAGAGGKHEAATLAGLCRAVIDARIRGTHSRGVVTSVTTFGLQDAPDDGVEPTRPRWLFTVQVTARPLRAPIS